MVAADFRARRGGESIEMKEKIDVNKKPMTSLMSSVKLIPEQRRTGGRVIWRAGSVMVVYHGCDSFCDL